MENGKSTPTYQGNTKFQPGMTSFGFYDNDPDFQKDADKVADFCARRLGFPMIEIELQDINFYNAFEQAITSYGNELYSYQLLDNQLNFQGMPIPGNGINFNNTTYSPNLSFIIKLSENYGAEAGMGGNFPVYKGFLDLNRNQQIYDLKQWAVLNKIVPSDLEIRKIFYEEPPVRTGYIDNSTGNSLGSQTLLDDFGWANMSYAYGSGNSYLMMPLSYDIQLIQSMELNNTVRRSAYSFKLNNNVLEIFPVPTSDNARLWFEYVKTSERLYSPNFMLEKDPNTGAYIDPRYPNGIITNPSNVPYNNPVYKEINSIGRAWIFEYTLAICKETLGNIRGKYSIIPIPGSEVSLNGADLVNQGQKEQEALINKLRDHFNLTSRQSLLERKAAESDILNKELNNIPFSTIYIA